MPRHWTGSEWVNFKDVQSNLPMDPKEKEAEKHNAKLKAMPPKDTSWEKPVHLKETPDGDPLTDENILDEEIIDGRKRKEK